MKETIGNYIIKAISAWLQEDTEATEKRRAETQEKMRKAKTGRKLLSLMIIIFFIELVALWAMTTSEPMRACYGDLFQKLRPHAAAWADFVPRLVVVSVILLAAALALYTLFEAQKAFETEEDTKVTKRLEKVIMVLAGTSLWLMLFTLDFSMLVSIADANIMNTINIINAVLHPGQAFFWLLLTAALFAAIIFFMYIIVTETLWIIREMPSTIDAVRQKIKARRLKKAQKK